MLPSLCLLAALAAHGPAHSSGELAPRLTKAAGHLWLSWIDQPSGSKPARVLASSFDGRRWTKPAVVVADPDLFVNWADVPGVFEGGDGQVYAFWLHKRKGGKYAYDVRVGRRSDDGWQSLGPLHDDGRAAEHGFVSAAPTAAGLQVVWLDGRETPQGLPMTLRTAHFVNGHKRDERLLDPRVCDCCGTAAAATRDGVRVVYRDRGEEEIRDMASVLIDAPPAPAAQPTVLSPDRWQMPGCPVNGPSVATDGQKTAAAWFTAGGGRAEVRGGYLSEGGQVSSPTSLWSTSTLGRVDLVMDATSAIATSLEASGDEATVVVRRFDASGAMGDVVIVGKTSSARASGFPQAEIFGEELIVVWTDARSSPTRLMKKRMPLKDIPAPATRPVDAPQEPASASITRPRLQLLTTDGRVAGPDGTRPMLLHLWATWCAPCLKEMSDVVKAAGQLRARGVDIVLLSVDGPDQRARVAELAKEWGAPELFFVEAKPLAEKALGARVVPATYLFDADGELRLQVSGAFDAAQLLTIPLSDSPPWKSKGP